MASENGSIKQRRYDPSMSRRTRRPAAVAHTSLDDQDSKDGEDFSHMSLKELMNESSGEGKHAVEATALVAEEKSMALIVKQGEGAGGVGTGGVVGRCVRVLNHLIKVKRGSRKRSPAPLLMK